ncbi:MAG: DUF427 domain-containing protein [Woeseiaceae bacterium]
MNSDSDSRTLSYNIRPRPDFAIQPGPHQESVWDYPRPPAIRRDARLIEVLDGETVVARSSQTYKVMETASPPTFYIPAADVNCDVLQQVTASTYCEWKGSATYWALARDIYEPVGWTYERPRSRFDMIKGFFAFYPGRVDCRIDGEQAITQRGRFYGGWITSDVVGPFKGEPGTGHW